MSSFIRKLHLYDYKESSSFVTGFSGLFAPYWDDSATGMLIGITGYTTKEREFVIWQSRLSHSYVRHTDIARATLEATCFQTRAMYVDVNLSSKL